MKQYTTNYFDTFIEVPEDCPVLIGEIPPERKTPSVARKQFDLLKQHPYHYDSDEIIYQSTAAHKELSREEFFAKPQACMRAASLVKHYGWGIHANSEGKIAMYSLDSKMYHQLKDDSKLTHIKSMRRKKG
jgi:hypothetical protein